MFDCGVNLASNQYYDYIHVMKKHSIDSNINGWIAISNCEKEWDQNLTYCHQYSDKNFTIKMTIGIHPHSAKTAKTSSWTSLESIITNHKKIVAIGECGLDYNRMFSPKDTQIEVFISQIELAHKYNLPLYLHEREAHDDFYDILLKYKTKYPKLRGIVHCFTGNEIQMKRYLYLRFYIGITGWLCDDKRNKNLMTAIKSLPFDKLILETDSPFLIPYIYSKQWNTKRNQPDSMLCIIDKLVEITGQKKEDIIKITSDNTKLLFGL